MFLGHKELKHLAITSLCVGLLTSCPKPTSLALAKVDDQSISATDLTIRISRIPGFLKLARSEQNASAEALLESLVDDRLLYLEALAQKIEVSESQIDHAIGQHRALLGDALFSFFTNRKNMTEATLRRYYNEQLCVLEYLKRIQVQQKPFCDSFDVQSLENCTKRSDFMRNLRNKHNVVITKGALIEALNRIVEGGQ